MRDLKVWTRVGDQDDYHSFDSPEQAAEHVHEYLHWPPDPDADGPCEHEVTRYVGPELVGIELPGTPYEGNNAVSLYWGSVSDRERVLSEYANDDAQLDCELTDFDLTAFTSTLSA